MFSYNGLVGRIGGALTCMRSAVSSDMSTVQFELALRSWMLIRGHFGSSDRFTPVGQVFVPLSKGLGLIASSAMPWGGDGQDHWGGGSGSGGLVAIAAAEASSRAHNQLTTPMRSSSQSGSSRS